MQRLSVETWNTILTNMDEAGEEVEVVWLDSPDEWVLCCEYELFEDGFQSEEEADRRLEEVYTMVANYRGVDAI